MRGVPHPWLQVDQDGARDVSRVVALVVEDVLAVAALGRKVFEVAVLADSMLLAQLLPELAPDCRPSISFVAKLSRAVKLRRGSWRTRDVPLLPHWPA